MLSSQTYYTASASMHDDDSLVVDHRAHLTPAEMVDAKLYALLGTAHNSPQRDLRGLRGRPVEATESSPFAAG